MTSAKGHIQKDNHLIFKFELCIDKGAYYIFKRFVYDYCMPDTVYERGYDGDKEVWIAIPFENSPLNVCDKDALNGSLHTLHGMLSIKWAKSNLSDIWTVVDEAKLLNQYRDLVIQRGFENVSFNQIEIVPNFYDEKIIKHQT